MKRLAYIWFCLVVLGVTNALGAQVSDLDQSRAEETLAFRLESPTQGLPGNIEEPQTIYLQPTVRLSVKKMAQTVFGHEANIGRTRLIFECLAESQQVHFRLEKYRIDSPFSEFW